MSLELFYSIKVGFHRGISLQVEGDEIVGIGLLVDVGEEDELATIQRRYNKSIERVDESDIGKVLAIVVHHTDAVIIGDDNLFGI